MDRFKKLFANNIPGLKEIELNMFDLVVSSIRKGPNIIVFGKSFQLKHFKPGFSERFITKNT